MVLVYRPFDSGKNTEAHYVKDAGETPPKIHDLVKLAEKTKLNLTKDQIGFLLKANNYNLDDLFVKEIIRTGIRNYSLYKLQIK